MNLQTSSDGGMQKSLGSGSPFRVPFRLLRVSASSSVAASQRWALEHALTAEAKVKTSGLRSLRPSAARRPRAAPHFATASQALTAALQVARSGSGRPASAAGTSSAGTRPTSQSRFSASGSHLYACIVVHIKV